MTCYISFFLTFILLFGCPLEPFLVGIYCLLASFLLLFSFLNLLFQLKQFCWWVSTCFQQLFPLDRKQRAPLKHDISNQLVIIKVCWGLHIYAVQALTSATFKVKPDSSVILEAYVKPPINQTSLSLVDIAPLVTLVTPINMWTVPAGFIYKEGKLNPRSSFSLQEFTISLHHYITTQILTKRV